MYNETNLTNAGNMYEIVNALNELSSGWLGMFLLAITFFLTFIIMRQFEDDTKTTFMVASFLTTFAAIPLWSIGLISTVQIIFPIIMTFAGFMLYWMSE